jgi:hypothetical protein
MFWRWLEDLSQNKYKAMKKLIFIIAVSIFVASPSAASGALPLLLEQFLVQNKQYHLLEANDIEDEAMKRLFSQQLKKPNGAEFAPFQVGDFNGDGVVDVAAILVKNNKVNAIVIHGSNRTKDIHVHWLLKDDTHALFGVGLNSNKYVVLLDCYGCHASYVYGWSGTEYENGLVLPRHFICVDSYTKIHTAPDEKSKVIKTTALKTGARVVKLGAKVSDDKRWYQVKLDGKDSVTGFVTNKNSTGFCDN